MSSPAAARLARADRTALLHRLILDDGLINQQLQRRISRYVSAVATVLVFVVMLHPNAWLPFAMNDRLAHFLVFYALTMMFLSIRSRRQSVVIAFAVAVGCATEGLQLLTESRSADAIDLVANLIGIGTALICWTALSYGLAQRQKIRQ